MKVGRTLALRLAFGIVLMWPRTAGATAELSVYVVQTAPAADAVLAAEQFLCVAATLPCASPIRLELREGSAPYRLRIATGPGQVWLWFEPLDGAPPVNRSADHPVAVAIGPDGRGRVAITLTHAVPEPARDPDSDVRPLVLRGTNSGAVRLHIAVRLAL